MTPKTMTPKIIVDPKTIISQLAENFEFTMTIPDILGVMLYGSYAKGEETARSDIDICIVTQSRPTLEIWNRIMILQPHPNEKYSIFFFHEIPLYIKKDVFTEGKIICSPDPGRMYEFFHPYRKIWADESYIMRNA